MSRPTSAAKFHKSKILHDKYLLGDEIGKGAYGRVYKGVDLQNGDFVAIKQVSMENILSEDLATIMSEIDLLKNLNHKNIVKYLSSFKTKSHLYIILEYVENGSLASIIKPNKFGAFPESLAAVYIAQVLEGLVYLHEQDVIHRDIKGANILTTKEGLVKLADFGVATKLNDADVHTHSVVGTPYWMAPEVIEMSGVSMASDIWSVGCTVIELLTCVPPYYDLQPMPALFRIVQDDRPPLPEHLSPPVADFLCHCFQKDAKLRPDAKSLLKHPWLRSVRRQMQSPVRTPGPSPSCFSEIPEEVVVERVYIDDADAVEVPLVDDVTIAIHQDPFDSDSDEDEPRFPRSPSMSYPASEEERRSMEMHHPIRISRKGVARQLRRTSGSHSQERFPLLTIDQSSQYSPDAHPPPLPYPSSRVDAPNGERSQGPIGSGLGLTTPPRAMSTGAKGDVTPGSGSGMKERGPGVGSTSASAGDIGLGVQGIGDDHHRGRGLGGVRVVDDYDQRWVEREGRSMGAEPSGSSHSHFQGRGIRYDEGMAVGTDFRQLSLRALEDRGGEELEDGYGGSADHPGLGSFMMPPRGLPPRGARERTLLSSSPQGPASKLKARLSGKRDSPVRPPRRRTRSTDSDSADDDEMDGGRREVLMKQAVEIARLTSLLKPEESEDNLMNICDRLLSIFREFPDDRFQLVSQLGVTPVMEMLEVNANERVLEKILMVLNQVIRDNVDFQESLCLVGLIPAVLQYADKDRYRSEVRLQAAYFINQMCDTSALTLQMFIACRGLPTLVRLLEYSDYLVSKEMVHVAIEGVWRVFELQGPTPRQDLCRVFTKAGILERLIVNLVNLNEAYQKVIRGEAIGQSTSVPSVGHSGPLGYGNGSGRPLPMLSMPPPSFHYHPPSQPVSPHGAMLSGPLGPVPSAAPPPPPVSLVTRSLSWTRRGSNGSVPDSDNTRQYEEETGGGVRRKSGGLFSSLIFPSQNSSSAHEKASLAHSEPSSNSYQYSLSTGSTYSENTGLSGQSPAPYSHRNGAMGNGNQHYGGGDGYRGGWAPPNASQGQNSGQMNRGSLVYPPAEVSYMYANKVADLLLEFSRADSSVKQQMASLIQLHRLFKLLDSLEPSLLVKVLRAIRELSTDLNASTVEALQRADVIKVMVTFLEQREGEAVAQIHHQVLHVLSNVCTHNKQRLEQAAMAGIIPHLQYLIAADSVLQQIAVTLLCDMAHASRRTREELRKHQVLETYLSLLKDSKWAEKALDSIAVWLAHDHEQRKVEQALLRKESLQKLVDFFGSVSGNAFVQILEPFYRIITKSSRLNTALAVSGLMPILVARLDNENPIARLTLLKIIFAVYEHHPRPKQLIVEHDLAKKLQRMVEDKRGDEAILLKNMASALLKGLHMNSVL